MEEAKNPGILEVPEEVIKTTTANKLDKVLSILIQDMDADKLWHIVFNKMTNAAKRQMLGELLNQYLGSGYSTKGNLFD